MSTKLECQTWKLLSFSEICGKYMQVGSAVEEDSEEPLYFLKGTLTEAEADIAGGFEGSAGFHWVENYSEGIPRS